MILDCQEPSQMASNGHIVGCAVVKRGEAKKGPATAPLAWLNEIVISGEVDWECYHGLAVALRSDAGSA